MDLLTPLSQLTTAYKMYAKRLQSLDIVTVEDLLYYIPFRYEDYSVIATIGSLQVGEKVTVQGKVIHIKTEYTKRFKNIQKAILQDDTGTIDIIWFNQPYLTKMIHQGDLLSIAGKVEKNLNKLQFTSPDYEILYENPNGQRSQSIHTARLVPLYHETKGVSSKWLRRQLHNLIQKNKEKFTEYLPYSIINTLSLLLISDAIEQIHFPKSVEYAEKARLRLAFEELFLSQITAIHRKHLWKKNIKGQKIESKPFEKEIQDFIRQLPFQLTSAQQRAINAIFDDMKQEQPMNRLLEGDVGSGKTVVATIAIYLAFLNNKQSVLMAPTEILTTQHFETISKVLSPFGVKVALVTGSKKIKRKKKNVTDKYVYDILIGTHAVLSDKINFDDLGLVVIDEQQRFGVEQRSIIRNKGTNPHFLTMTATPIPRTIALTMYGDLDLSLLDEMPKRRKIIKTWLVPPEKRENAYQWIKKQIKETDSQAFIICPFIEESETMITVKAATKEYEKLKQHVFPDLKLGLLHGKMKSKEKDEVLQRFRDKKSDILVATPVVEVGIDIPNATIILIEAAERFGLAQLHQLRGRVGRGEKQSYCLLFTESKSQQTIARLKAMERMHVGATLAEFDLQLRGPGDMYGTAQHGIPFFKIASFADVGLIELAKQEAEKIFPELHKYPLLLEKLKKETDKEVSPD